MVTGVIIIGICVFIIYNTRTKGVTQKFLDGTLGKLFKKKGV